MLPLVLFIMAGCGNADSKNKSEASQQMDSDNDWVNLLQDKNLSNWEKRGGDAKYHVEENQIVGTTIYNTENTFLCTKKDYSDFILEVDVKVDTAMNSGIQIRSHAYDQDTTFTVKTSSGEERTVKRPKGRVHGYQVEIDPSDRAWSGGIYDEARRGWLYNLDGHPKAQAAFHNGEWNKYRIMAKGDSIKTWINGVPAAKLKDDMDSSGFIGLQVHHTMDKNPHEVRWRNIRIKTLN